MTCPNCQHPNNEHTAFCEQCGTSLTPTTVETPEIPTSVDTPAPAKKHLLPVLLIVLAVIAAAAVTVCGFVFGWWGGDASPEDTAVVTPADDTPAATDNFTMNLSFDMTVDGETANGNGTVAFDTKKPTFLMDSTVTYDGITGKIQLAYEKGGLLQDDNVYLLAEVPGEPLRATVMPTNAYLGYSENLGEAFGTILSADPEEFDLNELIDTYPVLESLMVDASEDTFTVESIEQAIKTLLTDLRDEAWLTQVFGMTKTVDGNTVTVSFDTDGHTVVNALADVLLPAFSEEIADEARAELTESEEDLRACTLSLSVTVSDDLLQSFSVSFTVPDVSFNANVTATDTGHTTVSLDELKAAILEANDGHKYCVDCGTSPAVCNGYCGYCYANRFCIKCGEPAVDNTGYCADCLVPCIECGDHAEYEEDGEMYCYSCYYDRFCYNDDGNPVYKDGYCEECFVPCAACEEYAGEEFYDGFCVECYYERFCYNDDGNPVYKDGYCEECYAEIYGL